MTQPGVRPGDAAMAEVLFLIPDQDEVYYRVLLELVQPHVIVPYHWDDFWRPLSKPLRPHFNMPRLALPPLERIDLDGFKRTLARIAPGVTVLEPKLFRPYEVAEFVSF